MQIKAMQAEDWSAVAAIYQEGIATRNATFEDTVPAWSTWDADHLSELRLVAHQGDQILGWAALTAISGRCVYAGVAEVSVYVGAAARGQGVGKALLTALIDLAEQNNLWTLQAGIFPENTASLKLHQGCGFREVGVREKIGQMDGVWRDVVLLERRSQLIGH